MIVKLLIILHHSFNHCLNLNLTIDTTKIPQEESNNPAEIKVHISQQRYPQLQDYCSERKGSALLRPKQRLEHSTNIFQFVSNNYKKMYSGKLQEF
jgi:hypothetical protein